MKTITGKCSEKEEQRCSEQNFLKKSDSFYLLPLWRVIVQNNVFFTTIVTVISKNKLEFLKRYLLVQFCILSLLY